MLVRPRIRDAEHDFRSRSIQHVQTLSRALTAALVLTAAHAMAHPAPPADSPRAAVRQVLPADVIPSHYDLLVSPDAESLTFRGKVAVDIDVRRATRRVVLNSSGLIFDRAHLETGSEASATLDAKLGRATLEFPAPIALGPHTLTIEYHGPIGRSTIGFFAMDYTGPEGARRTLATNFEPAHARQLLPCWDEPALKATFTVSVDTPADRTAYSNMPVSDTTPLSPNLKRVHFATTPRMSSYLLFLGVGDFERVHRDADGVDVGVIVKRGDSAKAGYALEQAAALLHYYDEYFGVRYPLPKLDLVTAPGRINGIAMENWGAIFYSQDVILFDPDKSTEADRQTIFEAVSHEMAHQWFGDLVTMSWWDDLWLNEGFARWMQTYAADDLHPEWETGLRDLSHAETGKELDSAPSTHPVVQKIYSAAQAEDAFDAITYAKGASIIKMLNAYVGRDAFRDGVRAYMRAHAYGNTVDADFWTLMERTTRKPILAIERDFTRQAGIPLTVVERRGEGVGVAQARFAEDRSMLAHEPPQRWRLPITVAPLTAGPLSAAPRYVLVGGSMRLPERPPVLINAGDVAYTRVLYRGELFDGLTREFGALHPSDQLGLLNDGFALSIAGYVPVSDFLRIVDAAPAGADSLIWRRISRLLLDIDAHYGEGPQRARFRAFALERLAASAAAQGAEPRGGEPANVAVLRGALTTARGRLGDPEVIANAHEMLEKHTGTPDEIESSLTIVAMHADAAQFDALLARAETTQDPLDRHRLFEALSTVEDPALARRFMDIVFTDRIPAGDTSSLLFGLSERHPDLVWQSLALKIDDPGLRIDAAGRWKLARSVAARSSRPERVRELEAYEARSVPPEARKPFLGAVASIRQNGRIEADVLPAIDRWLEEPPGQR
jgi:aminopeptidase N